MGIDIHNLNLLARASDLGARFDRTLAIGRQALYVTDTLFERHRRARQLVPLGGIPRYFEPIMQQWYGARAADSVDASEYEGARFIHDMNMPWTSDGPDRASYDAVLDFGCLEHIFNFPVAWKNCLDACRPGGHVLHALPANNAMGHGFYQFSPELFFNLYRPENGFELQALYLALQEDPYHWWDVASPLKVRRRVHLCNSHEVYMLVLARKLGEVARVQIPQQSDYAQGEWLRPPSAANPVRPRKRRDAAVAVLTGLGVIEAAHSMRARLRALQRSSLSLPEPDFHRLDVAELLAEARQGGVVAAPAR